MWAISSDIPFLAKPFYLHGRSKWDRFFNRSTPNGQFSCVRESRYVSCSSAAAAAAVDFVCWPGPPRRVITPWMPPKNSLSVIFFSFLRLNGSKEQQQPNVRLRLEIASSASRGPSVFASGYSCALSSLLYVAFGIRELAAGLSAV